jgi:acyl-CoA thioesterase I
LNILECISTKNSNFSTKAPVTAVFLGDSVTHGCFETYINHKGEFDTIYDFDAVYHNRLKRKLQVIFQAAPFNVINAGIGGGSAPQGNERLERDVIAFSPALTVVCFGLNDVHGGKDGLTQYTHALSSIFDKLLKHGSEVIFMTPNMMNTYVSALVKEKVLVEVAEKTALLQNNGMMDLYMDAAKRVCQDTGVTVCDCYSKWKKLHTAGVDITALLSNGINHPTREMHDLFASSLLDTILFD